MAAPWVFARLPRPVPVEAIPPPADAGPIAVPAPPAPVRRRSSRLRDSELDEFVDMLSRATRLKQRKMGEAPPPLLTRRQLVVLAENCELDDNALDELASLAAAPVHPPLP